MLLERLTEPRGSIQVLQGPRQVGKSTLARQVADALSIPVSFVAADAPTPRDSSWLEATWAEARTRAQTSAKGALLILDEIQKVPGWSETLKLLWDRDTREGVPLRILALGSSPLLMQRGLTESLAGRFEIIRIGHWSFPEMRDAFGFGLDQYLFFGGYPGAARFVKSEDRWRAHILDAHVEATIARDVLLMSRIDRPALLRRVFFLGCEYSGRILSLSKMLGQMQESGNTATVAHYLDLLAAAGLLLGLQKYSGSTVSRRASSPKFIALNTALVGATTGLGRKDSLADPAHRGRLVETTVGAHLLEGGAAGPERELLYWRHRDLEVDFVVRERGKITAIEVTSGRRKDSLSGLTAFGERFACDRKALIGGQGVALEEFLSSDPSGYLA